MSVVAIPQTAARAAPRNLGDRILRGALRLAALTLVLLVVAIVVEMLRTAVPAFRAFGWRFLVTSTWDPVAERFGVVPFLYGTVVSSLLALLIAVPLGIAAAIYLAELAPAWLRPPLAFLVELVAAVPSVIYGLWGIFVLAPLLRTWVQPFLGATLGFLPLFQGPPYGVGMLAAGIIMAIMVVPFITAVSREVLLAVPNTQREAALALGATRWETTRMAGLRYGRSGLVGAILLGLGGTPWHQHRHVRSGRARGRAGRAAAAGDFGISVVAGCFRRERRLLPAPAQAGGRGGRRDGQCDRRHPRPGLARRGARAAARHLRRAVSGGVARPAAAVAGTLRRRRAQRRPVDRHRHLRVHGDRAPDEAVLGARRRLRPRGDHAADRRANERGDGAAGALLPARGGAGPRYPRVEGAPARGAADGARRHHHGRGGRGCARRPGNGPAAVHGLRQSVLAPGAGSADRRAAVADL